jgi:hypothetical protein
MNKEKYIEESHEGDAPENEQPIRDSVIIKTYHK